MTSWISSFADLDCKRSLATPLHDGNANPMQSHVCYKAAFLQKVLHRAPCTADHMCNAHGACKVYCTYTRQTLQHVHCAHACGTACKQFMPLFSSTVEVELLNISQNLSISHCLQKHAGHRSRQHATLTQPGLAVTRTTMGCISCFRFAIAHCTKQASV